jgi:hypothetical protein
MTLKNITLRGSLYLLHVISHRNKPWIIHIAPNNDALIIGRYFSIHEPSPIVRRPCPHHLTYWLQNPLTEFWIMPDTVYYSWVAWFINTPSFKSHATHSLILYGYKKNSHLGYKKFLFLGSVAWNAYGIAMCSHACFLIWILLVLSAFK